MHWYVERLIESIDNDEKQYILVTGVVNNCWSFVNKNPHPAWEGNTSREALRMAGRHLGLYFPHENRSALSAMADYYLRDNDGYQPHFKL